MGFIRLHPSIYRLGAPFPGGGIAQIYLVRGTKTALIDSGVAFSPDRDIDPALRRCGLQLRDIDFILNTHGHYDHLGGNARIKELSGASVLMHEADTEYARRPDFHVAMAREPYDAVGLDHLGDERSSAVLALVGRSVGVDRILTDGEEVDFGDGVRLRTVHTPGHTAGSVCFYWEREGVLFSGDAVQSWGSRAGGLPGYESPPEYVRSLQRLTELDIQLLLMGHYFTWPGPLATAERTGSEVLATLDESRRVSLAIENAVQRALEAQPGTRLEVAQLAATHLMYDVPIMLDPTTRLPIHGIRTLVAHVLRHSAVGD